MTDPLSLTETQAPRRHRRHDPAARDAHRGPRDADRRLPPPRRRRDARLPPRVRRGRGAARAGTASWASARGACSRSATGIAHVDHPPGRRRGATRPDLPVTGQRRRRPARRPPRVRPEAPRRPGRRHAAVHRRRGRRARLRRDLDLRAVRAAARPRPGGRPARELHRDRPRDRVRPPDPPAERDRVAPHRRARPRGPLPDRRAGDLRGPRADRPPRPGGDDGGVRTLDRGRRRGDRGRASGQVETSLGRDEYIRAVERAKDAIAAGEAIQVVLARRQSFDLPAAAGRRAARRHRPLPRAPPGQPQPVPVLHPHARVARSSAPARSSSSRSRATGCRPTRSPAPGRAARRPADDDRLADELRNDPKERAEHVMLVDLGRNDLGRVAKPGTVTTSQYMEVERYSHVLHLVSHVEAQPPPGARRARRAPVGVPGRAR